jgi:hypothetical protein
MKRKNSAMPLFSSAVRAAFVPLFMAQKLAPPMIELNGAPWTSGY